MSVNRPKVTAGSKVTGGAKLPAAPKATVRTKAGAKKKNKYELTIAIIAIALLAFFLALYFLTHTSQKTVAKQSYQTLPQYVIDAKDQAVRLQVILQTSDNDSDWLQKNSQQINLIFQQSVKDIDPTNFRSGAGLKAIQEQLKDDINSQMKVNKIQAVLYTDVIVQFKDEGGDAAAE